jgi:hypothetical protein
MRGCVYHFSRFCIESVQAVEGCRQTREFEKAQSEESRWRIRKAPNTVHSKRINPGACPNLAQRRGEEEEEEEERKRRMFGKSVDGL